MTTELEVLKTCRTFAVVGLSSNRMRPSNEVAAYMQRARYRIIPVNPLETEVLGEKAYARLEDVPDRIDCVNIFRLPQFVPDIVESAIAVNAKAVWMQLDIAHEAAARRARDAGLLVVEDRCLLIEHRRYRAELAQSQSAPR